MNHCIPGRKLKGGTVYDGLVVTPARGGETIHLVFRDASSPLFKMPASLFQCPLKGLTNTERLRREQVLEFGDKINFTCKDGMVVDYEKYGTSDVDFKKDKYLIKTLCVLPPNGNYVWTKVFGVIGVNEEETLWYMRSRAFPNVAVECWLEVNITRDFQLQTYFVEFIGISQDDASVAWDADWNVDLKPSAIVRCAYETDDEDMIEEHLEEFCHRDDYAHEIGVKCKLEGVVISSHEIFCPQHADKRVYVGLWNAENVNEYRLEGHKVRFDAFYSEITNSYICYYYEFNDDSYCVDVMYDESNKPQLLVNCRLSDYTNGGFLEHSYFGLIADRRNFLRALPYLDSGSVPTTKDAVPQPRRIRVYILDRGPNNALARFEISSLPPESLQQIAEADQTMLQNGELSSEGFVVKEELGRVYAPKFPTAEFYIPRDDRHRVSTGVWIRFKAFYNVKLMLFTIIRFDIIYEKERIDCQTEEDNCNTPFLKSYEFKICVELRKTPKNALYNRSYGFVEDPDKKFIEKKTVKTYYVIVVQNTDDTALTLFKVKRMSRADEVLTKPKVEPKIGRIISTYSDDEEAETSATSRRSKKNTSNHEGGAYDSRGDVHDYGEPWSSDGSNEDEAYAMLGLENLKLDAEQEAKKKKKIPKKTVDPYQDDRQLSGVEFNSKYLRRERKVEARQRKIERERAARCGES